jgi:mono/diheme cytochrome c family protein
MRNPKPFNTIVAAVGGIAAAILVAAGIIAGAAQPASANPAIAQKTGQPCSKCHTAAPALNAYGKKYKQNMKK